jgi:hypothetical protein
MHIELFLFRETFLLNLAELIHCFKNGGGDWDCTLRTGKGQAQEALFRKVLLSEEQVECIFESRNIWERNLVSS